jgi:hypothetical protein
VFTLVIRGTSGPFLGAALASFSKGATKGKTHSCIGLVALRGFLNCIVSVLAKNDQGKYGAKKIWFLDFP